MMPFASSVFSIGDWQFWLFALVFILFQVLVLQGLGNWFFHPTIQPKSFLEFQLYQIIKNVVGLAVFTLAAYLLASLNFRMGMWGITVLGLIGSWRSYKQSSVSSANYFSSILKMKHQLWLVITILVGSFWQLLAIVTSGLKNSHGVSLFFTNESDGMMHLAFAQALLTKFPPVRPEILNQPLTNYHYFTDLILAEQARLFGLPIMHSFFQFWPIWIALMIGILLVGIMKLVSDKPAAWYLGLGLWYGSGEISYLVSLLYHRAFNWNVATIENSADQFLNMPQMFAKLLVFAAYFLALRWFKQRATVKNSNMAELLACVLVVIASTGFKVYFGVFTALLLIGLLLATYLHDYLHQRKPLGYGWTMLFLAILLLSGTIWLVQAVSDGQSKLEWIPFVWPKLLLSSDHLNLNDWWLRMQVYEAHHNQLAITALYSIAVIITILGMVGTKVIGLWALIANKEYFWHRLIILLGVLGSCTVGLNTLQNPGGFNTYNFVIVAIQPLFIVSAITLAEWWSSKNVFLTAIVLSVMVMGSFRPIANNYKYWQAIASNRADSIYSTDELEAFKWLATNTNPTDVLQSLPNSEKGRKSAFLAFFTNRQTYVTGTSIAQTHGIDTTPAQEALVTAFKGQDYATLRDNLRSLGIHYLYIERAFDHTNVQTLPGMAEHIVFSNAAATIVAFN